MVGVGVGVAVVVGVVVGVVVAVGVGVAVGVAVGVVVNMNPTCMSCRRVPGVKKVLSINGRGKLWKCQGCLDRKSVSFFAKDEKEKIERRTHGA